MDARTKTLAPHSTSIRLNGQKLTYQISLVYHLLKEVLAVKRRIDSKVLLGLVVV
jgi:hypothetical protein